MIVLPALPAIVSALTPIVQAALVSAGIGAVVGGATCAIGGAVSGYHEYGELNRDVATLAVQSIPRCAAEGAVVGGLIAPAGIIIGPVVAPGIAPIMQVVDDVARPAVQIVDDVAKTAAGHIDEAAVVVGSAASVDDVAIPVLSRVKTAVRSAAEKVGQAVTAPWRKWRASQNIKNAVNFRELPKTYSKGNEGYVYVMDDVSTPGRFKLGKTTQPVERISNVQSKTGLKLDYTCIIKTDDMKTMEGKLFEEFKPQRRPNMVEGTTEIFILNAAQVAAACSR